MTGRTTVVERLLPPKLNDYRGSRWVVVAMGIYAGLLTVRSLIHMFAPDGGANSIATIDISVEGGDNIVGLFAQWGALQLMLACMVWVVVLRLRVLVPLMAIFLFFEPILRAAMGALKPITTDGTAPGAALNDFALIPLGVLLVLSITTSRTTTADAVAPPK
jgi:hypothetical protein